MSSEMTRRMPLLRTGRLVLRRPEADDAPAIARAMGDHAVARMLARVPQPYDLKDAGDWLAQLNAAAVGDGDPESVFAITEGGPLEGIVAIDRRGETLHIGYWLARAKWGRGIMSEAVAAVLTWHFDGRGGATGETLQSGVFADNAASLRIQQKLGFNVTGRSDIFSLARGEMVAHIDTAITADGFRHRLDRAA